MGTTRNNDSKLSDRLPNDWQERVSAYRGAPLQHYQRVLKTLSQYEWMTQDERERAAFVYVEKELLREQGQEVDEE
ncbi:MAG: hypothetical protein ACRDD1_05030 [Planctomycetia bacterium]